MVHLDTKPKNIIMGGLPRLIDLSIARGFCDAAALDVAVGTDAYMAPEQCTPTRGALVPPPTSGVLASRCTRRLPGRSRSRGAPTTRRPQMRLDVSIQAQIMNLLEELQDRLALTYLFIAHDLAAVQHICNRIMVIYLGRLCEVADRESLVKDPRHPYTQALLSAVPVPDPQTERQRKRVLLSGDVPSPLDPPSGCRFYPRCPYRLDPRCESEDPPLREIDDAHRVACF
jgi:oligopeptide/dipeptide ABC transporter ATP-binding protein